jgi:hypothetical protein
MTNRRNFIKQAMAVGVAGCLPSMLFSQEKSREKPNRSMIWANLLHLSYNMWEDRPRLNYESEDYQCNSCQEAREWAHGYRYNLTFDETVWNTLLKDMVAAGMNMVIIDLGDAVVYESHPELAVRNAWTPEKLRVELSKLRKMGLEPIPKLNFATTHDAWMGVYSRMVSSRKYYDVCRDLIDEVIRIFDRPRFFHIGMDEEEPTIQSGMDYAVVRQNDLWWGDLYFLTGEVEKHGVRPWMWSDYGWQYPDVFFKKMPKSVLQSNWYYEESFDKEKLDEWSKTCMEFYEKLEKHGYDQVPTGSNHSSDKNMEATVDYCKQIIDTSKLYGFMVAPWRPTLLPCLETHKNAVTQLGRAIKKIQQ